MKKKVFIITMIALLWSVSVVSAASLWGKYKGNDIVRLTINGTPAKITDVPAISYNNRTMIPIYLLQQAGINYSYDAKTKTLNIISQSKPSTNTQHTPSQQTPQTLSPAYLYSNDGKTYLGKLTTDEYDTESVFNQYGDYGSKYSKISIWNEYGDYGSDYSNTSAWNEYATKPPVIVQNEEVVGYVSANTTLQNSIHPRDLYQFLADLGY